jgi:hypothetical protein
VDLGRSVAIVLTLVVALASPASAQFFKTRTMSQVSIGISCVEPGCDCVDATGAPVACPGVHVREYDTGDLAVPAVDVHNASVSGHFVGYDSETVASVEVAGTSAFGVLSGLVRGTADAMGAYVDAGGLAIPATADSYVSLSWQDLLSISGAAPGAPVTISFTQSITSAQTMSVSSGLSLDPCLANAVASILLNATLTASGSGGQSDLTQLGRFGNACQPVQDNGSPIDTITLTVLDGQTISVGQGLSVQVQARMDGGLGTPNRATSVLSLLDASNTARTYVEVLTPGASYTSASGTVYPTPEPGGAAGGIAALTGLALLARGGASQPSRE